MNDKRKYVVVVLSLLVVGLMAFLLGRLTGGDDEGATPETAGAEEAREWTCSMHPQIRRSEPGSCPICGMDLIPIGSSGEEPPADRVVLSDRARVLARLRTESISANGISGGELRLSGRIDLDETTQRTVTSWIGGRIDRLHVRVTGEPVRRGQTLASLYSPEVYAAQRDLSAARRQIERLSNASELVRSAAESTRQSARARLRLLGIPDAEITRMEAADRPTRNVSIRSPFSGTVLERIASEGSYVTVGGPLYRIADLTRLWVQLDAYESDLPRLAVGQAVALEVEAFPGRAFEGRVSFVDPVLDPRRRTARVRVEVSNSELELRPGMFVEAVVRGGNEAESPPLSIPATAALFTGRRSIVYVEVPNQEQPTYEARTVRLGPRGGDRYPVVDGLAAGERVVVQGAFAIDADLQIRGGASMMSHDEAPDVSREIYGAVVSAYLDVQRALAADDLAAAHAAATALARISHDDETLRDRVAAPAHAIEGSSDLSSARVAFEPLSGAITRLLRDLGNPTTEELRLVYCPMAFDNRGAEWVQSSETIDNAYFGDAMRSCGTFRQTFDASAEPEPEAEVTPEPAAARAPRRPRPRPSRPTQPAGGGAVDHSAHTGHQGHQH